MSENRLCYGCMEVKGEQAVCPHCGYQDGTPYLPDYIAPGTMLRERYLIGVLLGYNGEGATYLAYDTVICCKVLIREYMPIGLCTRIKGKPIISVNYNNLAQYKALMAEYTELNKTLARMRNLSHINPTLDLFAENNTTYTVFEYTEGVKLLDFLKDNAGELSWNQAKKLFPPLFTTLSLVHNAGIVHRGISPETIYVTEKGNLQLSAFCISSVRTANTELKTELFPGYAAPEQYSASGRQGTWTDVYGICAVLYRILTGCMPTEAPSRLDNDNLCAPHELSGSIPVHVSRAIMDGLALNSDERTQTITELVTRLFEETEEETAQRTAVTPPPVPKYEPQPEPEYEDEEIYEDYEDYEDLKDGKSAVSAFDKVKVPMIIGILLITVILIVALVLAKVFRDSDSQVISQNSGTSSSLSDIVTVTTEAVTATKEYDSVMINVVGMDYKAKKADLAEWIELNCIAEEYSDEYPAGQIIWQSVKEGEDFKSGDTLDVKVSLGPSKVKVPEFKGVTLSAYIAEIEKIGIKNHTSTPAVNYNYATGAVIKTSVEPGETIDLTTDYKFVITYADNPAVTTTAPSAATTAPTTGTTVAPPPASQPAQPGSNPGDGGQDLPGIEDAD